MPNYQEGIVEQIFLDSNVIVISVNKGKKRLTVSLVDCDKNLKLGDFVLYDGKKWFKNPNNKELQRELKKLIEELYNDVVKK